MVFTSIVGPNMWLSALTNQSWWLVDLQKVELFVDHGGSTTRYLLVLQCMPHPTSISNHLQSDNRSQVLVRMTGPPPRGETQVVHQHCQLWAGAEKRWWVADGPLSWRMIGMIWDDPITMTSKSPLNQHIAKQKSPFGQEK